MIDRPATDASEQQATLSSKARSRVEDEHFWFSAAVVGVVLLLLSTACGVLSAFFWYVPGDATDLAARVDVVYKVALIGAGVVTFCTVAWRGLVATRQAAIANRQTELTQKQIAVAEANNVALLLQKGAELLSSQDKPTYVSAGIATLHAVAVSEHAGFALSAFNLLAEFIGEYGDATHSDPMVTKAIDALNSAHERTGRRSNVALSFTESMDSDQTAEWKLVLGAARVTYVGGQIVGEELRVDSSVPSSYSMSFKDVRLELCFFSNILGIDFEGCVFVWCEIQKLPVSELRNQSFEFCDFSHAEMLGSFAEVPSLVENGCWYDPGAAPRLVPTGENVDWSTKLLDHRPPYRPFD